jgi:2-polyprenyl-6-methoxyphenol hydroxylase-like FAD-dependent oxidoreductase
MRLILRPALHKALLEALGPDVVEVDRAATRYHDEGARVRLDFADGTDAAGDILIGADGVGSVIRGQLHPGEPPPKASGYLAIRGLSYAVERLNGLTAIWYMGRGAESGIVQTAPDAIYWFVSLFADDVRAGTGEVEVHEVMRRCTAGWDEQFRAITGATMPEDMRIDELFVREPLARWGSGRVTLLGDAAHPMLPHTGQGAAQALEDAVALGRALAGVTEPVAALRRYEEVRARRTRRVVRTGPWIARVTTTRNPVIAALRNGAMRLIPERVLIKAFTQPGGEPPRTT